MNLTAEQRERIGQYIPAFRQYLDSTGREADMSERQSRHELYRQLLSPEGLAQMNELEFGQVISSLWASRVWSNMSYLVNKLVQDNGLETLRQQLHQLLWGQGRVADRYDAFRRAVKGLGPASVTELLAFVYPDQCGLWNDKVRKALALLGFRETFPLINKSQIKGREYERFNELLALIRDELAQSGIQRLDFLGVDYFLFVVWEVGRASLDAVAVAEEAPVPRLSPDYDFDHDEIIDHLVAIGQWLGFQAEKEKLVARGARVDAVWQARIANLGVVTDVFEVQRKGSVDSLVLNLQKAQNNPSVQRLIVVANSANIDHVRQEIATLPESFRKAVGFMDVAEVERAAELIEELAGIIDKLDLVRSEFGV